MFGLAPNSSEPNIGCGGLLGAEGVHHELLRMSKELNDGF